MNPQQGRRYIKNRMGDELQNKILEQNGIIIGDDLKPKPTIMVCPRCEIVNQIENKYCSKCTYLLNSSTYEEIKQNEENNIIELEKKYAEKISTLTNEMELKFQQLLSKIELQKLN